jgi:uncharacterized membrane protein
MSESQSRKLERDRLVLFCDAVIAIAITLLVLDLRIVKVAGSTLTFSDLWKLGPKLAAYTLSFFLIGYFWIIHHKLFRAIIHVNERLIWLNLIWLFFIAILPFTTTTVSSFFGQKVSVFLYSLNVLLITLFQGIIWSYVIKKPSHFLTPHFSKELLKKYSATFNTGVIILMPSVLLSFISPTIAFFILFIRPVAGFVSNTLFEWINRMKATSN